MNENIMRKFGFGDYVDKVKDGNCPFCTKEIILTEFRNTISVKEYKISGLCQTCQDVVFGKY